MAATYPRVARELLEHCVAYRQRAIALSTFKNAVWAASNEIVIPQERDTHDFLQHVEGTLDFIEHTVDENKVFAATMDTVRTIEAHMTRYLEGDPTS